MKKIIFFLVLFPFTLLSRAQEKSNTFPEHFLGKYKGDLEISSQRGTQKIPMEFHLTTTEKDSTYNYIIIYNKTPRNYLLKIVDQEKGMYNIDENNGIILPASLHNNTLHSFFEVQGNFLSTRLHFKKNTLDFEILFTKLDHKIKTGGVSKQVPEVSGYPISVFQKAVLKRLEDN